MHVWKLAAAGLLAVSAPAMAAAPYDAAAQFTTASASGTWSYGFGTLGTSFTLATTTGGCGPSIDCWQPSIVALGTPFIGLNNTGSTIAFGTGWVPVNMLVLHPGPTAAEDAIVRFTAPLADTYTYAGHFGLVGYDATGVQVGVHDQTGSQLSGGGPTAASPGFEIFGGTVAFSGTVTLAAGEYIDIGVNNGGSFFGDSTVMSFTMTPASYQPPTAVPEPASWAMLIAGFGLTGAAMRRRRRMVAA